MYSLGSRNLVKEKKFPSVYYRNQKYAFWSIK